MPKKNKKPQADIHLSKSDSKVGGVVGGISEYYHQDPAWVRVLAIILIILTGIIPGLIIYGVFYTLMKRTDENKKT